jgi:hypothetical protein
MCITRTELVYPQGSLQWLLVFGVLVSSSHDHGTAADKEVCGFLAQYTQTYSYAKLSGIRSAIPSYTSVSASSQLINTVAEIPSWLICQSFNGRSMGTIPVQ